MRVYHVFLLAGFYWLWHVHTSHNHHEKAALPTAYNASRDGVKVDAARKCNG